LTPWVITVILTNIVGDITNNVSDTTKKVGVYMLEPIVGSKSSEQVFIFLIARQKGYATEIANYFDADLYAIQKQLVRLEDSNVLVSRTVGRTRVYQFNPRYPFLIELKSLLEKVLSYYPDKIQGELLLTVADLGGGKSGRV
jgi:hypothetical protein